MKKIINLADKKEVG